MNWTQSNRNAPGPGRLALLANLPNLRRDLLQFCQQAIEEYGDIVQLRVGPIRAFLVNHPEAAHRVFVEKNKDYVKTFSARAVSRILGQGLITSKGELWRRQRKLIQPVFHREILGGLAGAMSDAVGMMLNAWSMRQRESAFDLHDEMMRLTLRIIGQTLFSIDIDDRNSELAGAFSAANAHADHYIKKLVLLPAWIPTPRNLAVRRTMRTLNDLVARIIDEHRKANRSDLLAMLLAARDEDSGEYMSDRQLHDEILTIVAAGHETTANALTWCFHLLSAHPDVERRLYAEVLSVLGDRAPRLEDLPSLTYTNCVLQEAMRLYPPVWAVDREAMVDDELLGYRIPAGSSVMVFTYGLHRHKSYWENPSKFEPCRFLPENSEGRHRAQYLPFGMGPRRCVGNSFAMMEAQIALAMIVQRYRLTVVPGHPVEMAPLITLRPKHGLRVTAESRKSTR